MTTKYLFLEPMAKKAVDECRKKKLKGGILMMIDGFVSAGEAMTLRDMLWYARDNGVEVRFIPHQEKRVKK
jgi:hypothetical protein